MHGLRVQYQDRVNFVILDYDLPEDVALARALGVARHPAYALIGPADGQGGEQGDGPAEVQRRIFGPQTVPALTALIEELLAQPAGRS